MLRGANPWSAGCGIAVRGEDLVAVAVRLRFGAVAVAGRTLIRDFRNRPAEDWGAEYAQFLASLGLRHVAATFCIPRDEVVFRTLDLPPVPAGGSESAIAWQLDDIHPYGDSRVCRDWSFLSDPAEAPGHSRVAAVVAAADTVETYGDLFARAGVRLAACTVSASALRSAMRLRGAAPPRPFLVADRHGQRLEFYGESGEQPAWSSALDLGGVTAETALRLALENIQPAAGTAAGLALAGDGAAEGPYAGFTPLEIGDVLPVPERSPVEFELARDALPFATAIESARPNLGLRINLLPDSMRRSRSVRPYAPTVAIACALALVAAGLLARPGLQDARYAARLQLETDRLSGATGDSTSDSEAGAARLEGIQWLSERENRVRADLAIVREIAEILPASASLTALTLTDDLVTVAGTAEDAGPLLGALDRASTLDRPRFARAPSRTDRGELFQIEARRK